MMRKPLFLWKRLFLQESCRAAAAPVHFPWLQRSEGSRGAAPFSSGAFGAEHGERWRRGLVPEPGGACRQPALPRTLRPCRGRVCTGRGIARDVPVCVPGQRPVSRVRGNRDLYNMMNYLMFVAPRVRGKCTKIPPAGHYMRDLTVRREAALPVALPAAACWGKGCAPPYGGEGFRALAVMVGMSCGHAVRGERCSVSAERAAQGPRKPGRLFHRRKLFRSLAPSLAIAAAMG